MKKTLITLAATALMAAPAAAYEFKPTEDVKIDLYGQIYLDLFYHYGVGHNGSTPNLPSEGFHIQEGTTGNINGFHSFGSDGFTSSRLGVSVNYKDIVGGTIEFGTKSSEIIRRAFLQVYMGGNTDHNLLIGKTATIAAYSFGQVSYDGLSLNGYGTLADNRRLQLQYNYNGFQLAIIMPNYLTDSEIGLGATDSGMDAARYELNGTTASMFNSIPRIELAYTLNMENESEFKVFAGYGAYVYELNAKGAQDPEAQALDGKKGVNHTFHVGIGGTQNFGNSFLNYTAFFGQNLHLIDAHEVGSESIFMNKDFGKNKCYNLSDIGYQAYTAGGAIGFGHTFAEKYTLQAGVGYVATFGPGYKTQDDRLGAYINTVIKVNDWYSIIPEVAYLDELIGSQQFGEGNQKQGYAFTAGVMNVLEF